MLFLPGSYCMHCRVKSISLNNITRREPCVCILDVLGVSSMAFRCSSTKRDMEEITIGAIALSKRRGDMTDDVNRRDVPKAAHITRTSPTQMTSVQYKTIHRSENTWTLLIFLLWHVCILVPCLHLERYRTGTNCSGTDWIGSEPRASIPVPERYRSTYPHYKLSRPNCTETFCSGTCLLKYWVSDRNGTVRNERYILQMWTGGAVPHRSKNASMDRVSVPVSTSIILHSSNTCFNCGLCIIYADNDIF